MIYKLLYIERLFIRIIKCFQAKLCTYKHLRILSTEQNKASLTTDDGHTCHVTLAACYQLAQSVLKIGFVLAKKVG